MLRRRLPVDMVFWMELYPGAERVRIVPCRAASWASPSVRRDQRLQRARRVALMEIRQDNQEAHDQGIDDGPGKPGVS